MDALTNPGGPGIDPPAKPKAVKPKVKKPAKAKPRKASKPAKSKKKAVKKAAKVKRPKVVKTKRKLGKPKVKPAPNARSMRLDMRLTKAEKAKVIARAKKLRRTVTSIIIEAIEKIK